MTLAPLPSRRLPAVLALLVILLAACAGRPAAAPAAPGGKLRVVATFSILGDLVHNVGQEQIELRVLVGPGGDAHTFEPSPADGVALAEAALVFENGLGFDGWLADLYASSGSQARRVVVTAGISPLAAGEQGEFDPHVWSSVANTVQMVENVGDALAAADPANAALYQTNADSHAGRLQALDAWVFEQVEAIPPERRKLVTSHDTLAYFAGRYGFEVVGTALGAASTEVADPSAGTMAALVEEIRAAGVPAIFAENVSNQGLMERLAAEAGVTLGPPLYTDALGPPGSDGDSYEEMVRANVTAIVAALGR